MAVSINGLIDLFLKWVTDLVETLHQDKFRPWNLMGFDKDISSVNINEYFKRVELNKSYVEKSNKKIKTTEEREAVAQLQLEINAIYSIHKSFASRHKTRLQCYKDDLSHKKIRLPSAINVVGGNSQVFTDSLKSNDPTA